MDFKEFVANNKSMLIAPAGYGKTHTIAECIEHCVGKQLILTHTHAGVASIKEKIKSLNISPRKLHVETITSYAQKYVLAFYKGEIPPQEDAKEYYPFLIKKATELIQKAPIADVIKVSYSGLFVDEYQDCTTSHHQFILALSTLLPTRILGDHLQGIFNFNREPLISLESEVDTAGFNEHKYLLQQPWRWIKGNNTSLGDTLKQIRKLLEDQQEVDLSMFKEIETVVITESDLFDHRKQYNKTLREILQLKNVLIIHPDAKSVEARKKIVRTFNGSVFLIEAIDDKDFYRIAKCIDGIKNGDVKKSIRDIAYDLFNPTSLDPWFNEKGLKRKKGEEASYIEPLAKDIDGLCNTFTYESVFKILEQINHFPQSKCYRKELLECIYDCLKEVVYAGGSVYEVMVKRRNYVRRAGKKIYGRCIGTTLLTKGLEFETVVILNAHKFACRKNLYVALTRASKRLIIFTESFILNPYNRNI
jgi:hypothetical protein